MRNPVTAPTIAELFLRGAPPDASRYDQFFPWIRLHNGSFKTTSSGRQTDVNDALCELLSSDRTWRLLDVAVSSGAGTVELSRQLTESGIDHQMVGTDLTLKADCLRLWPVSILAEPESRFLYQVDIGPFGFPNTPPSKLSGLVFAVARRLLWLRRVPGLLRTVRLLSPVARDSRVVFETGDLFGDVVPDSVVSPFDVIRASNILNRSYFPEEQLRTAIRNLHGHLKEHGLLVVNRTQDTTNHFTIFRRAGTQLEAMKIGNGGCDIEDLVAGSVASQSVADE